MTTTAADRFGMDETTSLLRKDATTEPKPSAKKSQSFQYAIGLAVITGLIFFLISSNMPKADVIEDMESTASTGGSTEQKSDTTSIDIDTVSMHMTLHIDEKTGLATLVDRAPIACRPSSLSTWFKCGEGSTTVLATADYRVNHNGNGWNYLSIEATDMRDLMIETIAASAAASASANDVHVKASANTASHKKKPAHTVDDDGPDGDDVPKQVAAMRFGDLIDKLRAAGADLSPVRQQYVRTMHGIGMLEGFLACKEIGEWYANFYDGLFEGGEVNRPTMEFLEQNHVWMNNQASLYWEVDEYWMVVKGIMAQLEGLLIGAQQGCPGTPLDTNIDDDAHSLSDYKGIFMPSMEHGVAMQHLLLMNANGDMFQIMQKFPANVVNSTTTRTGRHGDSTIDTTPTIDDYVDDYTINLTHNKNTTTTADDDETYVYGEDLLGAEGPDSATSAAAAYRARHYPPQLRQSRAATLAQRNNPALFYQPQKFLPSDIPVADASATPKPLSDKLTAQQVLDLPNIGADHCSAIIKLLPDKSDVVFGHDTWDSYQTAFPRVFKHIRYNRMKNSLPIAADMIDLYFSASPGLLASIDDYYIIHGEVANLAVLETSLDLYNQELMQLIYPSTMLCWARAIAANRLATSGNTWVEAFSRYHSGTYSNQWMVLDFNKFQPYQAPRPGFLTVMEELPGLTHHEDVTETLLTKGYWASYNNPYFKEISVISGVYAKCQLDATYCHPSTPRAKIFREQQGALRTVADVQALMQYNRYATDRASGLDSCKAIACRKDLEPAANRRAPFGAIDAKVSSVTLAKRLPITSAGPSGPSSGSNLRSSFPNDRYHLTGDLVTATTGQGTVVRQSAYYGVIKPVILTKLGPSTDSLPPFCWSAVGETTSDATVMFVTGMVLPDTVIRANITAPAEEDTSNTRRLRALQETTSTTSDSSSTITSPVLPTTEAAPADQHHEEPVTAAATPTAQPTFLEGPRKYVHWGHPRCFDYGWETMPPQDTRTSTSTSTRRSGK